MFRLLRSYDGAPRLSLTRKISTSSPNRKDQRIWNLKRTYVAGVVGISTGFGLWTWSQCAPSTGRPLSIHSFSPVDITSSEVTGKNTKLLRLQIPEKLLKNVSFPPPIWSIFIKDSDIQIERPFTPLEAAPDEGELELWVKKYPDSEMGRWIHSRAVGESIEIRGPHQTWAWKEGVWDRVVMIAGGTGVTPFHQLLHRVFAKGSETTSTEFVLLHGYRSKDELPPKTVMQNLSAWARANPSRLVVRTFVEDGVVDERSDGRLGRVTENDIREGLASEKPLKTLVLVCGPEPMIEALAGPKDREGGQGTVGGLLARIPGNFEVWKL